MDYMLLFNPQTADLERDPNAPESGPYYASWRAYMSDIYAAGVVKSGNALEPPFTATYLHLFDQIWNDAEKVEDVTGAIVDHIATVYKENSPESIYFLMLFNIFNEFLEDISEDVLSR